MNKYGIRIKIDEITSFKQMFTEKGDEKIKKMKENLEKHHYDGIMIEYPYGIIMFNLLEDRDKCFEELQKQNKKVKKIEFVDENNLA